MFRYSACKSGIIQRGEEIFPSPPGGLKLDYVKVCKSMAIIPLNGERLMTTEEVLELYD